MEGTPIETVLKRRRVPLSQPPIEAEFKPPILAASKPTSPKPQHVQQIKIPVEVTSQNNEEKEASNAYNNTSAKNLVIPPFDNTASVRHELEPSKSKSNSSDA